MTLYHYRAARPGGSIATGQVTAASLEGGHSALGAQGLMAIELVPLADRKRPRFTLSDSVMVFRSLANLIRVGVPLERAVGMTESMLDSPALANGLGEVRLCLQQGSALTAALDAVPGLANPAVLGVIRAGEESGRLGAALELVATQLEREHETAGRLRQAMAYPAILLVTGSLSVALITAVVLPRFARLLADAGGTLPPLARLLLWINSLPALVWLVSLIAVVLSVGSLVQWIQTPSGRVQWEELLLRAPLIGPVRSYLATARLSRSLGTSLAAGLPLLRAMATASEAAANEAIRRRLLAARDRVAQGEPVARAVMTERAIVRVAGQMLAVGEASGQLGTMAERAAEHAMAEAERRVGILVRIMEPGLILVFGGLLAVVAGALLQTVYSLRPAL